MPEPVRGGQRYLPGLDGLRALAVLAVVAYHVGLSWVPGGLLGVGIFFTLSGYLITDLLLGQKEQAGRLQMLDFWQRRARRLLPALFVMLAVVICWVALASRSQLPALRGAVAAAALYVSNWWLIGQHSSYFANFGPQSPLGHLWSLAVEEQFYLLWPWLVYLGLRLTRARRPGSGEYYGLAAAAMAVAAGSALAMGMLYHPGYDPTRVYDGTDTRAFALLLGAALAFAWPSRNLRRDVGAAGRWCLDGVGLVGLLVIAALIWRTTEYSAFLYPGGMVVLSLATVLVIAAVTVPGGRIGQLLGVAPLRWIGVRSYGIYLWHFPVITLTTPADGRDTAARAILQVAASIALAALSWRLIEEPVRHGAIGRWWSQARSGAWRRPAARRQGWAALAGGGAAVVLAGACLAGVVPPASAWTRSHHAAPAVAASRRAARAGRGGGQVQAVPAGGGRAGGGGADSHGGPRSAVSTPGSGTLLRSSCQSVVHIGDSTSDGLVSASYLPNRRQRLAAQYARRGVRQVHWEISGGRSVVETLQGHANAQTVARRLIRGGYQGCWVLALGTNDTADVYVGSPVSVSTRIAQMMAVIGNQPVMWVNVISLLSGGPYSESDMRQWNHALLRACTRYPDMRVYDWASVARRRWFISDGIHYTSAGYAARSRLIAQALAEAFPASAAAAGQGGQPRSAAQGGTPSCLVR
jgi:peptidoglycan/LPS O-acetylase OafA/YrhL/lysophospholipase L1-like esterase